MFDVDRWQEIFQTIRANKLRTALTAFGVFWGVLMLLILLGAGNGLKNGVTKSMSARAINAVYVWGQRTTLPYQGMRPGRWVELDNADVAAVLARVDGIEHIGPRLQLGGFRSSTLVKHRDEAGTFGVMGDYPAYRYIQPMRVQSGRFINQFDMDHKRKVAVIGRGVKDLLFDPGEQALGADIEIGGMHFQIVGITSSLAGGDAGERQEQTIHIPFSTFQQAFNQGTRVAWLTVTVAPDADPLAVESEIRATLAARHKVAPDDKQGFGSFNAKREFDKTQMLFLGIKLFSWFVGVVTLLSGIIGVSNIMLIVVKERTREIGTRKALGATPWSIVSTVIQESIALTAIAGYLGMVSGIALLELVNSLGIESSAFASPGVDLQTALMATGILISGGALAGIIPAWHAANLKPVEALRAE